MYNALFDFNGDGKSDVGERVLEYMSFLAVTRENDTDEDGEKYQDGECEDDR